MSFWSLRLLHAPVYPGGDRQHCAADQPLLPYVTGQRTKIHISQARHVVGQMWKRRPFPAARQRRTPPLPPCPGTCWTRFPTVPVSSWALAAATAVGYGLMSKNDLGCHTEMMSDSIMAPDEGRRHQQQPA